MSFEKMQTGASLAALVVLMTACSDTPAGPADTALSAAEASFLAEAADVTLDGILGAEFLAAPTVSASATVAAGLAGSAAPVVTEVSFMRTRTCELGGEIVATGTAVHTIDREIGLKELSFEGTKSITACSRLHGDVEITIDGSAEFDGSRRKIDGQWDGIQESNQKGAFSYVTSDGREGECSFDLHSAFDPSTRIVTVTGEFCGREVFKERRRDG